MTRTSYTRTSCARTRFFRFLKMALASACLLAWLSNSVLADDVTFAWATVGNAGNAADSTGYGAVNNTYRISKHEVTNAQYTAFLNAVAKTDTNGLYNGNMANVVNRGGITRSGTSGSYTYTVNTNMGDKPVNWVSFFDAMRFTNWLENGQKTGMQDTTTTEAGVYTIGTGIDEVRKSGATYFISGENEWYKAAYHKNDGLTGNYWNYSNGSDTAPTIATADSSGSINNTGANVSNYNNGADWNGQNGNVTTIGSSLSTSSYGTFDQSGNVWEWNEAVIGNARGARGGAYDSNSFSLSAASRSSRSTTSEFGNLGFRVAAQVPEPSTLLLGVLGTIGLSLRRRR